MHSPCTLSQHRTSPRTGKYHYCLLTFPPGPAAFVAKAFFQKCQNSPVLITPASRKRALARGRAAHLKAAKAANTATLGGGGSFDGRARSRRYRQNQTGLLDALNAAMQIQNPTTI
jgi:hypothetical protein